jgi:DNA-binding transcriptional ArsR family regulator
MSGVASGGNRTSYVEDSVLTALFGNHAEPKILAALLSEPDQDLNVTQISELAGVSRKTVYQHLDRFVDLGLVEQPREVAGSKMYVIDTEDDAAEKLAEFEWEMIDRVAEVRE